MVAEKRGDAPARYKFGNTKDTYVETENKRDGTEIPREDWLG